MDHFRLAEVPVDTLRSLARKGFIESSEYRPSKANKLDAMIARLDAREQELALTLSRDVSVSRGERFLSLPAKRRHLVARTAYSYLRLQEREGDRSEEGAARALALLRLVNDTPPVTGIEPEKPVSPVNGHGVKMIAGTGGLLGDRTFGELQARFAYHDWLDAPGGFLKGATIESFNLQLRKTESDDLDLERLDIFNIRSLAPRNRFRKPVSWFVNGGLDRRFVDSNRELTRQIQGGPGLAWEIGPLMPYGFGVARAENSSGDNAFISTGAGARTGVLWYADDFQLGLEAEGLYYDSDDARVRASATLNLPITANNAVRARVERDEGHDRGETEFRLSWRYYFD